MREPRKRILIIITNQPDNLGDIIQNRNLIKMFRKFGDVVVDDHYFKNEHCRAMGIAWDELLSNNKKLPNLRSIWGILKIFFGKSKYYDLVIRLVTVQEYEHSVKYIVRELERLLLFILLRLRGIQLYQFGMTCNPNKLYGIILRIERAQAKLHKIFGVRDITVYRTLIKLGFRHLYYCPDVFYWDIGAKVGESKSSKEGYIIVSLRKNIPELSGTREYEIKLVEKVQNIINAFKSKKVVFCYQVQADYEFNKFLYDKFKNVGNCEFIGSCLDEKSAVKLYSEADLIISNRQHCLLFGAKLGTPILALTDVKAHWKLKGAFFDLGIPELLVDIGENATKFVDKCQRIIEKRDSIGNLLRSLIQKKRERALEFLRKEFHVQLEGEVDF